MVNTGLIAAAETEGELAGLIAHEIAHVEVWSRRRTEQATRSATIAGATIPFVFLGGPNGFCIRFRGQILVPMQFMAKKNEDEEAADQLGAEYLAGAGYDPGALTDIFARVKYPAIPITPAAGIVTTSQFVAVRARCRATAPRIQPFEPPTLHR